MVIPRTRLTQIFRQGQESAIVSTAHGILAGNSDLHSVANLANEINWEQDFQFVLAETPTAATKKLSALVTEIIPQKLGVDPIADIQILSPMYKGDLGIESLNTLLQDRLNPEGSERFSRRCSKQCLDPTSFSRTNGPG